MLDVAPSTASGYLTELRRADLVTEQREGKWVYYRLSDDPDAALLRFVLVLVAPDPQVGRDALVARRLKATSPEIVCASGSVEAQAPDSTAPGA